MTALPAAGWLNGLGHRLGLSAKLYGVAGLMFVALAIQAGGSFHLAGGLQAASSALGGDALSGNARAEHIAAELASHRATVEAVSAVAHPQEYQLRLTMHRSLIDRIRRHIHQERARTAPQDRWIIDRINRDLVELDLTGEAALRAMLHASSQADGGTHDVVGTAALQRSLRVFALSASRITDDTAMWREDRRKVAHDALATLDRSVAAVARWSVAAAIAAAALGLLGLAVLRGVLKRLGGITRAMLQLSRHEASVPIPGVDEPGPIGDIARAVAVFRDDARELERRGIERAIASSRLDAALNNMTQGLVMVDGAGRLVVWNRRLAEIFRVSGSALAAGMTIGEALGPGVATRHGAAAGPEGLASVAAGGAAGSAAEHRFVLTLDSGVVVQANLVPLRDGGWLATYDDITERRRNEARLVHLARHDALTDLPNRIVLRESVARAAALAQRSNPFAMLSINLDRFKSVNDALGHEYGDNVLRQVAQRLRHHVRATDTICRLGADAFVVVQPDLNQPASAAALATRLIEVLRQPYATADGLAILGASVGIALGTASDGDADVLLRNAELAQQRAKQDGGNTMRFYAPEMDALAQERRLLERDLHLALERGEFELFYQPLISVRDRRICAFEALLRWHHPQRGPIRPDVFIPLAEEIGLIVPIGAWVLRHACAEAARWPRDVSVAVNLSPVQFGREGLVALVEEAVAAAGIDATRLELEITESVLLRDSAATLDILHRLRALGVRISMDDFGTGYSSLSYLRSFPFDKIKIDKSFVHGLDGSEESEAIVRAIAGLGHSLGIATTAEGVETLYQLDTLVADGCTEMQGYLFSPPRPASDVALLLSVADAWPPASLEPRLATNPA